MLQSTPLTAIKACIKSVGSQLTALSLYGEGLPNAATIKEIGRRCPNLTKLDLCMGGKSGAFDGFEDAVIEAVVKSAGDGVAVFDSAGKYGAGLALEVLGKALEELGVPPEKVLISNKLAWKRVPLTTPEPTFE